MGDLVLKEITCIGCPMGCQLQVEMKDEVVVKVTGNTCKRGEEYGSKECTNPTRIVTSSVPVEGGVLNVVPVKTERDIPKSKIFECIRVLKDVKLTAPVEIGDIVEENILGTGVNVIASARVEKLSE